MRDRQYILFWYIAETVPEAIEVALSAKGKEQDMAYQYPPKYEASMTIAERIKMDGDGYEPVRHENTGVDSEEALYESYLLPVKEAMKKLGASSTGDQGTISADVVRRGWEAIQLRRQMEDQIPTGD